MTAGFWFDIWTWDFQNEAGMTNIQYELQFQKFVLHVKTVARSLAT
jgi:hypothetical protein